MFLALIFPAVLLVLVVAATSFLLLEPCGVDWPVLDRFGACRPVGELAAQDRLAALELERIDIEREIYTLEREIAGIQCVATGPDQTRPMMPEGWANRSTSMLFGCWDISLDYRTRDVDTDAVAGYTDWQVCFDTGGQGREIMRDTAGIVCEGPVTASYTDAGLSLSEPGDLPCSDGGYIHRREISCQLSDAGAAVCTALQPETGGRADVTIARRD
ncbi:hypothetical protein [Marinibacterium sp. SX1]|uniref:hypothetical protein n=1 Tax=Marinibacterium sp. SX1 TaxID=3388424 RepID=UPI003D17D49A